GESTSFEVGAEQAGSSWSLYADAPGANPGACSVTDPAGADVPLGSSAVSHNVQNGQQYWESVAAFTPAEAGEYTLGCSDEAATYAVTPGGDAAGTGLGVLGGLGPMFLFPILGLLIGLLLIITTHPGRRGDRRRLPAERGRPRYAPARHASGRAAAPGPTRRRVPKRTDRYRGDVRAGDPRR